MNKGNIAGIIVLAIIIITPIMIFSEAKNVHNDTCIIQDKYEDEYTTIQPMPMGKAGIMTVPIEHHDYYFNTTKGVIPVTSKEYNHYNISDTLNISVNDKGRIRGILN